MCSGICPRSSAARRRILTLSFMCFWPIYSSQRVGRKVWSRKVSSILLAPPWRGSFLFFLDISFLICYTVRVRYLLTQYQHLYQHYSICALFHIVKYI